MDRFDVFPKTLGDFTERTLGGGAISLLCMLAACVLFMTEWASFRSMRTVDRLVVDTSADGSGRMLLNVDIYLPSLPCGEFVMDVTDDSGLQQLQVTRTLHKLRMDRHGVPIDIPQAVNWNETVAPAFQQRKIVSLMEDAQSQLLETLSHYSRDDDRTLDMRPAEWAQHRRALAEQAAALQGRLDRLVAAAEAVDGGRESEAETAEHLKLTIGEVHRLRVAVSDSRLFSQAQRLPVLDNLHAMGASLDRLRTARNDSAAELRQAVQQRFGILADNVQGFISAQDLDRKEKYAAVELLLRDLEGVVNAAGAASAGGGGSESGEGSERLGGDGGGGGSSGGAGSGAGGGRGSAGGQGLGAYSERLSRLRATLSELRAGASGGARRALEAEMQFELREIGAETRGEAEVAKGYCGSCHGAAEEGRCCNTCEEVRQAYRERNWVHLDTSRVEQCVREERQRALAFDEHEGCTVYGSMEVASVKSSFTLSPASTATSGRHRSPLRPAAMTTADASHFNVTHQLRRLSFGTDFPGQANPLDGAWTFSPAGAAVARYFLKVVPTTFAYIDGRIVSSNQFSVTQYFKPLGPDTQMLPSIQFTYEPTALKVSKTQVRGGSVLQLFTRCAAVIGGLFTVAGILDSAWYHSSKRLVKAGMGKAA